MPSLALPESLSTRQHLLAAAAAVAAAGGACVSLYLYSERRRRLGGAVRSTAASGGGVGGGAAVYESSRAVDEYLFFHYGEDGAQMPYKEGPKAALRFAERGAELCAKHVDKRRAQSGSALDLGCAVGGSAFALAKSFGTVTGVDFSHAFVAAADAMKQKGSLPYRTLEEGTVFAERTATVPKGVDRARVTFQQGDACRLPPPGGDFGPFDAVLCSNLLCRLPDPHALLRRLPTLVSPGGVVVLISPYSWLEEYTPRRKWLGGFVEDGRRVDSFCAVKDALAGSFELVSEDDMPFLIREHARKFQWGCSHASVWRRRTI